MASGLLHTTATLAASAVGVTLHLQAGDVTSAAAWGAAGLWCVIVQPDLDQIDNGGGYYGYYIADNTIGGGAGIIRRYWTPYARALKHRSFFSHTPIVGSLIRLVYGGWFFVLLYVFSYRWPGAAQWLTAIVAMDTLHALMDWGGWTRLGIFRQRRDGE